MIKVALVDDSALMRQVMGGLLAEDAGLRLLFTAADPIQAQQKLQQQGEWPDVIVLDIEMPRMDGLSYLRQLMAERPTPVVICSTLTEAGAQVSVEALAAGAVAIVTKPRLELKAFLQRGAAEFIATVKAASRARLRRASAAPAAGARLPALPRPAPKLDADAVLPALPPGATGAALTRTTDQVVAIGTSTGGTQALEVVLTQLPRNGPGLVIVQHMPEKFTAAFAARLDSLCALQVREAQGGERVLPGLALIAPGGRHLVLRRRGAQYHVEVVDGPLVNRHRPSVDVLFRSVARCAGRNALGIVMTGMGDDGAAGLLEMRQAGARTLAQDEASCVVFGMPREAIRRGGAERTVALDGIAREIMALQATQAGHAGQEA